MKTLPRRYWPRTAGFTLLEVLVGMALFSLVAVTVYTAFQMMSRSWESGESQAAASSDIRFVEEYLDRQLTKAFPFFIKNRTGVSIHFDGERNSLRFPSIVTGQTGPGGLYEFRFFFRREVEQGSRAVQRRLIHRDLREQAAVTVESVLLEGVRDLHFEYFGPLRADSISQWNAEWKDRENLPIAVRVNIDTLESGPWPPMVFRLVTRADRASRATAVDDAGYEYLESEPDG